MSDTEGIYDMYERMNIIDEKIENNELIINILENGGIITTEDQMEIINEISENDYAIEVFSKMFKKYGIKNMKCDLYATNYERFSNEKITPIQKKNSIRVKRLIEEKPNSQLIVNNVKYDAKCGIKTGYGVYKNGWVFKERFEGRQMDLFIFTTIDGVSVLEQFITFYKKGEDWLVGRLCLWGVDMVEDGGRANANSYMLKMLNEMV